MIKCWKFKVGGGPQKRVSDVESACHFSGLDKGKKQVLKIQGTNRGWTMCSGGVLTRTGHLDPKKKRGFKTASNLAHQSVR